MRRFYLGAGSAEKQEGACTRSKNWRIASNLDARYPPTNTSLAIDLRIFGFHQDTKPVPEIHKLLVRHRLAVGGSRINGIDIFAISTLHHHNMSRTRNNHRET